MIDRLITLGDAREGAVTRMRLGDPYAELFSCKLVDGADCVAVVLKRQGFGDVGGGRKNAAVAIDDEGRADKAAIVHDHIDGLVGLAERCGRDDGAQGRVGVLAGLTEFGDEPVLRAALIEAGRFAEGEGAGEQQDRRAEQEFFAPARAGDAGLRFC